MPDTLEELEREIADTEDRANAIHANAGVVEQYKRRAEEIERQAADLATVSARKIAIDREIEVFPASRAQQWEGLVGRSAGWLWCPHRYQPLFVCSPTRMLAVCVDAERKVGAAAPHMCGACQHCLYPLFQFH